MDCLTLDDSVGIQAFIKLKFANVQRFKVAKKRTGDFAAAFGNCLNLAQSGTVKGYILVVLTEICFMQNDPFGCNVFAGHKKKGALINGKFTFNVLFSCSVAAESSQKNSKSQFNEENFEEINVLVDSPEIASFNVDGVTQNTQENETEDNGYKSVHDPFKDERGADE